MVENLTTVEVQRAHEVMVGVFEADEREMMEPGADGRVVRVRRALVRLVGVWAVEG